MIEEITSLLNKFEPTNLDEISQISFRKRTDTKFLIPVNLLSYLLSQITNQYQILEINKNRISDYESVYFDTPEMKFYFDHHNGLRNRIKIRIRKYLISDTSFLEVKQQDTKGHTNKSRLKIDDITTILKNPHYDFIKSVLDTDYELKPTLKTNFKRFTLADYVNKERVTFDINLNYLQGQMDFDLNGICIIELKQSKLDRSSFLFQTLKNILIRPTGFSKYCMGIIHTYDNIKYNAFKPNLLKIKKLAG